MEQLRRRDYTKPFIRSIFIYFLFIVLIFITCNSFRYILVNLNFYSINDVQRYTFLHQNTILDSI